MALRAAKIARNQARLQELGLLHHRPTTTKTTTPSFRKRKTTSSSSSSSSNSSRSRTNKPSTSEDNGPPQVLRRSGRNRGDAPVSYHEEPSERQRKTAAPAAVHLRADSATFTEYVPPPEAGAAAEVSPLVPVLTSSSSTSSSSSFAKNSARTMHLDVNKLVLGASGLLGRSMERTGKAFVMEESARVAVAVTTVDNNDNNNNNNKYTNGSSISFNKYSGVQEWGNQAMFLWVNLNAPNCNVVNDFLDGGRQVTWFGGSRMHDATPAIQRLIQVGRNAAKGESNGSSSCANGGVVLWCRQYVSEKRTFAPYVCLGRLSYHSHQPGSQPLSFVWKLQDYELLANHADEQVRAVFQSMIHDA